MFAEVAVPVHVHQTFTYALPASFALEARPGCRVLVPFGRQLLTGYIVALHDSLASAGLAPSEAGIKEVAELCDVEPPVTPELLELTRWIAEYYLAPWGEVLKSSLPAGINAEAEVVLGITDDGRRALAEARANGRKLTSKQEALALVAEHGSLSARELARTFDKPRARSLARALERAGLVSIRHRMQSAVVRPKRQQAVRLCEGLAPDGRALTAPQERVLAALKASDETLSFAQLAEAAGVSGAVIRALERRGALEVYTREVRRDPLAHLRNLTFDELTLTPKQEAALGAITSALDERKYAAFLLHGLTGSGKTEVYMRAMRVAVERSHTALMLVPEIALTPMFARRLRAHFGEAVAILHSSLSDGERLDEWNRLRRGEARVCIGARSAVFAPLEKVGLIVVDEEHEASYKQDESPRYHGRDTAIMRASKAGAVVILGSATPSMETFHHARTGKYRYLQLDERIGGRALAGVEVVDMREVFTRHGKQQLFSDELRAAIGETYARGEQTMILLNRRGYSSFILCRSCGQAAKCRHCDVALTYHRREERLICHYCDHQERVPQACPNCAGPYLFYVGEGTEQIEARLAELYPGMRLSRLDRDTARRRGSFERLLGEFAAGSIDLLVGTQMIAKGHDFHNVTLVGVISVDAGLALPDFRAAERTFQLLTQVSGRAGRGRKPGRVLLQTYHPEHYALVYARDQVYERFYEHEIHLRREMGYPPFTSLINILVRHSDHARAAAVAAETAQLLRASDGGRVFRVLGPAPAALARLKGEHRWQILIKTRQRRRAREALESALATLRERGHDPRMINIEVDPVSLM
jgi:primosomal protein N' (replication factor Y)